MTKVELKIQLSGVRDGVDWPAPGEIVDVPADEAENLIRTGAAIECAAADTKPKGRRRTSG